MKRIFFYLAVLLSVLVPIAAQSASPPFPLLASVSTGAGLKNNLTHYWDMNSWTGVAGGQQINEASGSPGSLVLGPFNGSGAMSLVSGGILNNAIQCSGADGVGGFADTATFTDVLADTGKSLTIQCWVYISGQVSANVAWISLTSSSLSSVYYSLQRNSTTQKFTWIYYDSTGSAVNLAYSTAPSLNTWHHLVFGYDDPNKQLFMYLDGGGKQTASIANGPRPQGASSSLVFFNQNPAIGDPTGRMDEYAIWFNRVLSDSDVTTLYNSGAGLPLSSF